MPRPNTLPWDMSVFTGSEPVTTLSDNFSSLNNLVNDSGIGLCSYAVDTGSANNYVVTLASPPTSYQSGMILAVTPANSNTGASVINVNSLGNKTVLTALGATLAPGELVAGRVSVMVYDGTSFRVITHPSKIISLVNQVGNATVDCAGARSISAFVSWNSNTGTILTLQHVGPGVPVSVTYNNNYASSTTYGLALTDAAGTAYSSVVSVFPTSYLGGSVVNMVPGNLNCTAGSWVIYTGVTGNGFLALSA